MKKDNFKPTDVEEKFCKHLDNLDPVTPLDLQQFNIFMGLLTMSEEEINEVYEKNRGMGEIIKGRLNNLSYN